MRRFSVVMLMAVMAGMNAYAGQPEFTDLGESKYSISNGKGVTMVIDAGKGAKILSFKKGDSEIISQSPMREAFGSTFWTSPQKEWNWPPVNEYDKAAYTVEQKDGKLIMKGQTSARYKYSIRKEFTVDKKGAFVVTYFIVNESDETRKVAPWEITRVTNTEEGTIFFDAILESINPADLMPFQSNMNAVWYKTDVKNGNRKINADGKGWLAYADGKGMILVKKFKDLAAGEPAPDEAEIQVYVNSGKTYIELESQGAYTELKPGKELSYQVRWNLVDQASSELQSKKVMKQIKKLVK